MSVNEILLLVRLKPSVVTLLAVTIVIVMKTTKVTVILVATLQFVTQIHVDLLNTADVKGLILSAIVFLVTNR